MLLLATHAMGTRFEFVLHGEDHVHLRAVGEEALRVVEHWHARLSRFEPASDAARLNRDPTSRVDSDMQDLLDLCEHVRTASAGAFDIRTGPNHALDFGAIGKGWALDRAANLLRDHGITQALLHGGTSSVIALGAPDGTDGWKIAVRSDAQPIDLLLKDATLAVSAPRGRTDASGAGHILDPRTGLPTSLADTAAVIIPSDVANAAALADAWSTALVVLGERPESMSDSFESHIHTPARGWTSHRPHTLDAR